MRRLVAVGALTAALAAVAPASAMTIGARMAVWSLAAVRHGGSKPADLSAALDATTLAFAGGGDAEWLVADDANAVGGTCARSGAIGDSQSTWVETEVEGPGTVSFRWKVSSQTRLDTLSFWIDGVRRASIAGEKDWETMSFDVAGEGVHTLRWTYAKSASGSAGGDCGWLDDVQWSPGLDEMTLGSALDAPELDWTTGGGGAGEWSAVPSPSWDGVDACAAYAEGAGGVARIETQVGGPGTVSFRWKVAPGAAWSGIAFMVDGEDVEICEAESWEFYSFSVTGSGAHSLAWEFFWDGTPKGDAGFLDHVIWIPESSADHTTTTPTPVPFAWLSVEAASILATHGGDYEAAANATAANGVNKVWECYVAGLVPTNAADVFRAVISMNGGKPVIGWTPDLNEGGTKQERTYTVEGRSSLTEGDWGELRIENGELRIGDCRFFRVKVALP